MLYRFASFVCPQPIFVLILTFRANFEKKFCFIGTFCTKFFFFPNIQSNRECLTVKTDTLKRWRYARRATPSYHNPRFFFKTKNPRSRTGKKKQKLFAPRFWRKTSTDWLLPFTFEAKEKLNTCRTRSVPSDFQGTLCGAQFENH